MAKEKELDGLKEDVSEYGKTLAALKSSASMMKWFSGVFAPLLLAAIIGIIQMYSTQQSFQNVITRHLDGYERTLRRVEANSEAIIRLQSSDESFRRDISVINSLRKTNEKIDRSEQKIDRVLTLVNRNRRKTRVY